MPTVDSSSTVSDLIDEYADTASYREQDSATLAWRHSTVCRILAMKRPEQSGHGAANVKLMPPATYLAEAEKAEGFAQTKGATNAGGVHYGFEEFRQ